MEGRRKGREGRKEAGREVKRGKEGGKEARGRIGWKDGR